MSPPCSSTSAAPAQADAEAAAGVHAFARDLREQLEDVRQDSARDADARVTNADLRPWPSPDVVMVKHDVDGRHLCTSPRRYGNRRQDHLAQDAHGPLRTGRVTAWARLFSQSFCLFCSSRRLHRLHRGRDDVRHVHAFGHEHDLARATRSTSSRLIDQPGSCTSAAAR